MASTSGLAPEALKGKTRTEVSWSSPTPGPKARSRSLLSHKARCGIITLTLGELSVAKTNNVHTIRSFSSRHWPSLCDGKSNTCLLKYNTEIMWWGRSYLLGFVKITTDAHDLINIIFLIYGKEKVSVSVVSKTENASGWENCLPLSRRDSARLQDCLINVAFVSTLRPKVFGLGHVPWKYIFSQQLHRGKVACKLLDGAQICRTHLQEEVYSSFLAKLTKLKNESHWHFTRITWAFPL